MSDEEMTPEDARVEDRMRRTFLLVASAFLLALWILAAQGHWALRWDLLPFTIRWVADPRSGLIPLALALWLMVEVPRVLLRRSRSAGSLPTQGAEPARARPRTGAGRTSEPSEGSERVTVPTDVPGAAHGGETDDEGPRLRIPGGTFSELGAQHRWEMAEALGIPWRDELIHDHDGWAIACLEAAQRRAADPAG